MNRPRIVAWETTRRCDLACRHCRAAAGAEIVSDELSPSEGLRLIDALATLPIQLLILTGGEPMMRSDLNTLAASATARGIRVVAAPCGSRLTPATALGLKAAGVKAVSISLDAPDATGHDAFRGVDGAFEAALRGLRYAREAGLGIQINTTVSRLNVSQLPAMLRLAEREQAATLDFFFLVPTGRGSALADLQLDAVEVERTLLWIADAQQTAKLRLKTTCAPQMARIKYQRGERRPPGTPSGGCMAGRGFLFISHRGTVQPCGFLDLPCGNLRDVDFNLNHLLNASVDLRRLGQLQGIQGKCGICRFLKICGGCRARANAMQGDALAEEPFCVGDGDTARPA